MTGDVTRLPGTEFLRPVVQQQVEKVIDPAVTKAGGKKHYCQHRHIRVETDRRVFCRDCEDYIDPVDYLLALADWWDVMVRGHRGAQSEARTLYATVEKLKREEKNAKARIRRVEPDQVKEARRALDEAHRVMLGAGGRLGAIGLKEADGIVHDFYRVAGRCAQAAAGLHPAQRQSA